MNTEIAKRAEPMEPTTWQAMKEQAQVMIKSGFLPSTIKTPEQALSIALTGREMGIGFMESLRSINVIQGKPTLSPQLMLARAYQTKELEDIQIDATDERCIVTITRKGKKPHVAEFGVKEATRMGLFAKDNYKKQPKVMFQWRALAENLRVTFPDATSGMYTPEELGADVKVTETGMDVVDIPTNDPVVESNRLPLDAIIKDDSIKPQKNPSSPVERKFIFVAYATFKEYKPGKFRYGIKDSNDTWYTTFSETIYNLANEVKTTGEEVEVVYEVNEYQGKPQYLLQEIIRAEGK